MSFVRCHVASLRRFCFLIARAWWFRMIFPRPWRRGWPSLRAALRPDADWKKAWALDVCAWPRPGRTVPQAIEFTAATWGHSTINQMSGDVSHINLFSSAWSFHYQSASQQPSTKLGIDLSDSDIGVCKLVELNLKDLAVLISQLLWNLRRLSYGFDRFWVRVGFCFDLVEGEGFPTTWSGKTPISLSRS